MKKLIVVVTVPHTGTRSLMNIIDREGYVKLNKLLNATKEERKLKDRNNIQTWIEGRSHHIYLNEYALAYQNINNDPIILEDKINIIHGHISEETAPIVQFLSNYTRIITTCRDPLLTLISVNQRDKYKPIEVNNKKVAGSRRAYNELNAWILWAKYLYKTNPFIIPIDLKKDNLVYNNYDFAAIYDINITHPNNQKGYPLRTAYENGDLDYIKKELGESYNALLKLQPLLQPVLEEIGYTNLLWW